jgi:hypothetical protein
MGRGSSRRAGRRGRAKAIAFLAALPAAALLAIGCGASSHPNEPRPQSPTRISVTISDNGVIVTPRKVAFGPERSQQIPQNQDHPQPPRKTDEPLNVVFVIANQSENKARLHLGGPRDTTSGPLYPNSPGTMQTALPTGTYTVSASGVPGAPGARLAVGPLRTSSENDVLLP